MGFLYSLVRSLMRSEDSCLESVATFDKFADRYAEKYFALDYYDRFYQMLAEHIPEVGASVVDISDRNSPMRSISPRIGQRTCRMSPLTPSTNLQYTSVT